VPAGRKWELHEVRLRNAMSIPQWTVLRIRVDRHAEINGGDSRTAPEQDLRETAGAASNLEHLVAFERGPQVFTQTPAKAGRTNGCAGVGIELCFSISCPLQAKRRGVVA